MRIRFFFYVYRHPEALIQSTSEADGTNLPLLREKLTTTPFLASPAIGAPATYPKHHMKRDLQTINQRLCFGPTCQQVFITANEQKVAFGVI